MESNEAVDSGEDTSGLSPETKQYFEEAVKPQKKEKAAPAAATTPAAPEAAKPEAKGKATPEAKPEAPKDAPEVERENLKRAMNEERERRKEIAEQLKQEAQKRAVMEERFNRFLQLVQQQPEQQPPDFEKDPAAHLKAREEMNAREVAELKRRIEERDAQTHQERQFAEFRHAVASQTQSFVKEAPDYGDAYSFVRDIRAKELAAIGVPPESADGYLNQWEMQLAAAALQLGKNPAAALYAQAQALGYRKSEGGGANPGASEKTKLDQIARGQEAAKGLSGNGAAPSDLSLERIMNMDEEEMAELVRGKSWNKAAKFFK